MPIDTGWLIALCSLIVNILQLFQNMQLKSQLSTSTQSVGNNSNVTQQTHSGNGNNVNAKGNVEIKK